MTDKALVIEKIPASGLLRIRWDGGGEVPATLTSSYTSYLEAKRAISVWMANNRKVEVIAEPDEQKATVVKRGRPIKAIDE